MNLVLLAGGTGAAKLAVGLDHVLRPGELSVITNSADDEEFWGLLVCPDTDSVLYRLSGLFNESAGYGIRDETFAALGMLTRLGEATWFNLGDRDIGLHLLRDTLRRDGARLSQAVAEIGRRLGLVTAVIPMSDDPVRTRIISDSAELSLQEWFVRDRCRPPVRGVRFHGVDAAAPSPEAVAAVDAADAVVIGPSNPIISIDPILHLLRSHLSGRRVVAVSPLVGGRALKGPTVEMLRQLGEEATALGMARRYADVATDFVLDSQDRPFAGAIAALGLHPHVLDTVMTSAGQADRVAAAVIAVCAG
jgi:LPPG:FO 2-phospho-L-lactate transferase